MALKALKCPNCEANIQVDDDREYGFCSYCGAQVQIKEKVVAVHSAEEFDSARFMKLMEDSQAFLKMGNYFRAEEGFMEMIRLYPGKAIGYERLICTITHDYTLFPLENAERLQQLKKKMMLVAEDDEKAHYEEICERVNRGFASPVTKLTMTGGKTPMEKERERFQVSFLLCFFAIIICVLIEKAAKTSLALSLLGIVLCLFAVAAGITAMVSKARFDKLAEEDQDE